MRVLVGTLFSGENEYKESKKSLEKQTFKKWDHIVISGLPNKEAHESLYRKFMKESGNYDIFIKLDADMVFKDNSSIQKIVDIFKVENNLDHAIFKVYDWASGTLIVGNHVFSNKAEWKSNGEQLFVDYSPVIPGKKICYWGEPSPLILHSPNPSPFQAFHFGVHRALKLLQENRNKIDLFRMITQWKLLFNIWVNYKRNKDDIRSYILMGADYVIKGNFNNKEYKNKELENIFYNEIFKRDRDIVYMELNNNWGSLYRNFIYTLRNIKIKPLVLGIVVDIPKRMISNIYRILSNNIYIK